MPEQRPAAEDPLPSERLAEQQATEQQATEQQDPEQPDPGKPDPEKPDEPEAEWWDDPRMPWRGKPGRWDLICWFGIMFMGIYSLVMLPLRAYLVVANPVLQAGLTGSRSALVVIGVTDNPLWVLGLVLGIVSLLKFEWVFFLAGRLWGRGLIDMLLAGRSGRSQRIADKVESLARRYGVPAIIVSYLPIPLPTAVVTPAVAIAGMRWRTFWITHILCAIVLQSTWVALGFWLGEPARAVVEAYARISLWVSLALVVVVIAMVVIRQRRQGAGPPAAPHRR